MKTTLEANSLDSRAVRPGTPMPYAVAVCAVGAAVGLRIALGPLLGSTVPYITFFPAVMFAAWFGGFGPGLVSTFLSLAATYLIFDLGTSPAALAGAVVFTAVAAFICVLNEALHRSRARSEARNEELLRETDRRARVEEALALAKRDAEAARDLFRTTLASIGDAVVCTDAKGAVTFLNPIAEALTGWTLAEATGKPITEVLILRNETTGKHVENPAERALKEGVIVGLANHTVLVAKDGRQTPIEDSASPIRDEHGRILGAVLVFRDVSERRSSDTFMERSEERLRLALHASQTGFWDWDVASNVVEWSDLVYTIHGVKPGKFPGTVEAFAALVHPADRDRVNEAIQTTLRDDTPYDVEFRVVHPNGEVHWLSTTAMVFRDDEGRPIRMLGATNDITARRQSQDEIALLVEKLSRSNRDLDDFAQAAAHDLRSPLRNIITMTQLLAFHPTPDSASITELIVASAQRMDTLVRDLLEFSKAGHDDAIAEEVSLQQCLDEALTNLQPALMEDGARVDAGTLPAVTAHRTNLVRLFQNLVGNALKYKGVQPPHVVISAEKSGQEWHIRVEDNGVGFDGRYAQELFRPFRRLHGQEYPGNGLGLANCKRIVERYGGRIWAESVPGRGSTFTFTLPARETRKGPDGIEPFSH